MQGPPREIFEEEEKLNDAGLALPSVCRVLHLLKKKGLPAETDALTVEEAAERILALFDAPLQPAAGPAEEGKKG